MSFQNSSSGNSRNPLTHPPTRRLLRRLAWVGVFVGAAYTALVLSWILLDPRW